MSSALAKTGKSAPLARFSVGQAVSGLHLRKKRVQGTITHIFDLGFDSWLVVNVNGTLLNIEIEGASLAGEMAA